MQEFFEYIVLKNNTDTIYMVLNRCQNICYNVFQVFLMGAII